METLAIAVELGGRYVDLHFPLEPCGSIPDRGHLYHYVCEACRQANPRQRDEWVTQSSFLNSDDEDMKERCGRALEEIKGHVRTHEIIGVWAAGYLDKL